jgi:peptidoglycan-N-acetylglucosamine deacetylase
MFYLTGAPWLLRRLYPDCLWQVKTTKKIVYLTFDDGPVPEATPFVLDQLKHFGATATFFCIGKNVEENYGIYKRILDEGHGVGNHTYSHLNGWDTVDADYLEDIIKAKKLIDSPLFRPPYGRISRFQLKLLAGEGIQLTPVMWTILSGDFDEDLIPSKVVKNVTSSLKPGSIIVFHDSIKALPRLKDALPIILDALIREGYQFHRLPTV